MRMTKFLRANPGTWFPYASDHFTTEIVCALHNLGIAEVKGDRIILKSTEKADSLLKSRT